MKMLWLYVSIFRDGVKAWALLDALVFLYDAVPVLVGRVVSVSLDSEGCPALDVSLDGADEPQERLLLLGCAGVCILVSLACRLRVASADVTDADGVVVVPGDMSSRHLKLSACLDGSVRQDHEVVADALPTFPTVLPVDICSSDG